MIIKRSRIARSMSFSHLGLINQSLPVIFIDRKLESGSAMAKKLKPIFIVSSNSEIETRNQRQFENLFQRCYRCNKRMPHGTNVYMYGILHGFCSEKCRESQMVDDKVVVISQNSTGTKVNDQSGSQPKRPTDF